MKRKTWPWWIAAGVFVLDRITKILSVRIPAGGEVLVPGILGLRYAENRGIAFSMLSGQPALAGLLSLAVIAAACLYFRKKKPHPLAAAGLMMMLGGAAGNLLDRLAAGYVPDMIEFLFVKFAVFNVGDAFLCVGCALVILRLLFGRED